MLINFFSKVSYLAESYRGIAALLVVLFHTNTITAYYFLDQNALTLFFGFLSETPNPIEDAKPMEPII